MNIQPNLPSVNLISTTKPSVAKQVSPNEQQESEQLDENQVNSQFSTYNTQRDELFEQVESLDKNQQANLRPNDLDNKAQQFIQSYLDTQSLENQALKDQLHDELGVDLLA
jgi:hypothetical protein